MFPNPQAALPFPPRPNLEQYKKLAKELVKACKAGDADVGQWAVKWVEKLMQMCGPESIANADLRRTTWGKEVADFARSKMRTEEHSCSLSAAQFVIARSHGFLSWTRLAQHIKALEHNDSDIAEFEAAAEAIVSGDLAKLDSLLRRNPGLVRQRSTREHRATLLHYTAANGVEGYRQKTPKNIAVIAEKLLRAGAEVDAGADVYHGDCSALGLAATSVHPAEAGVQQELMQVLLDHGASPNKPDLAGNCHSAVVACFANGQPRAGEFLAAHGAVLDLESAAGLGRMDIVADSFDTDGRLKLPATRRQLQDGFLWACMYGRDEVARFLLERGADLNDASKSGATGLHWAAGGGHVGIVKLLLERGAALEVINAWDGTVLEHAGYGFAEGDPKVDMIPVFETLLAAGAKVNGSWLKWLEKRVTRRTAAEKARLGELLKRYGATE